MLIGRFGKDWGFGVMCLDRGPFCQRGSRLLNNLPPSLALPYIAHADYRNFVFHEPSLRRLACADRRAGTSGFGQLPGS